MRGSQGSERDRRALEGRFHFNQVFSRILVSVVLSLIAALPAVAQSRDADSIFPPWQHGANNDALNRGVEFTVPQVDVLADFHGDLTDPLDWETIPPGTLVEQMKAGGTITSGNMTWTVKADVYLAGLTAVQSLVDQGLLTGPAVPYVTNTLAIMVAKDNPHHIHGLSDLARPGLRLAMPNPAYEGIAAQINASLKKAGGDALAKTVYETKVADGSSILTQIHHRQTPLFLMQDVVDAGVTWQSEAVFQEQAGHPITHVDIVPAENTTGTYGAAIVTGAAHPAAAQAWLDFIHSPAALAIFGRYGFRPYAP
jgi:molybdate transport system substrate-binding protein